MAAVNKANTIAKPAPEPTCKNQFDREQGDDAESDRAGGGYDAGEIPEAGPYYRDLRVQGVRVDHRGDCVGGVVETVYEFKSERDE